MGLHSEPWIGVVLDDERMRECSTVVHGLRFYTPDVINGEAHSAFENAMTFRDELPIAIVQPFYPATFELAEAGSRELNRDRDRDHVRTEADMRRDGTLPPL